MTSERCVMPSCKVGAVHLHHAIYRQHIRWYGGDVRDARVLVPMCWRHHERHHGAAEQVPLHVLPDSVFEYAAELMGGPAAFEYLKRHYAGGDPRHDALLHEAA